MKLRRSNDGPAPFCADRCDDLIDYVFDEMGPGALEAFEAHLASCPGCRVEARSLRETLLTIRDAADDTADAPAPVNGDGVSWEEEWTLLRRRLTFAETFPAAPLLAGRSGRARSWLLRAAAVILLVGLGFASGYRWRGSGVEPLEPQPAMEPPAPISGASTGNYFDNLEDFTRDTHSFLRRTRMILMEFTKLGEDSDPSFFQVESTSLLTEVEGYREVASRMENQKLSELLDQVAGVLKAMATVGPENQGRVVAEVKTTLDLTGLVATLEILHAAVEREMRGRSNV
jgi:hypothetical protein